MEHIESREIFKRAEKSIPGGVNSPVRAFKSVNQESPVFIMRAKGSKLYDEDGNKYIDCLGSWGPMILGHSNDRVVNAVSRELEHGSSFGLPTKREVELAEIIKEFFPSIDKVRLTTSGTEATMAAVRVARAYTRKNKIVKFEGCYHGHSDSLMVKAGSGLLTFGEQDSNGITQGVTQDTITLPFGDVDKLKEVLVGNKDVACVIIEPIPANMGLIVPEKQYLQELRDMCTNNNTVLIFDEVISGFRLAKGGAQEIYGIEADLTTLGKIIGGGYPIGAFGGKQDIMDMISPVGNVYHAGTLSGNPISVIAGIETLNQLKEIPNFYKNLEKKTLEIVEGINKLIGKHKVPATVNHIGSLFTIFFAERDINTLEDVLATDDEMYIKYFDVMLKNCIMVPPSKYEAHFISAVHDNSDVERILKAVDKAFEEIMK